MAGAHLVCPKTSKEAYVTRREWAWGNVVGPEVIEQKITQGFVSHCKIFDFYSEWDDKSLEDLEHRSDMIWLEKQKHSSDCYKENKW